MGAGILPARRGHGVPLRPGVLLHRSGGADAWPSGQGQRVETSSAWDDGGSR